MMIAAAPAVAAAGALTVLTLIALLLCSLAALLAVLSTLDVYAAAPSLVHPNLLLALAIGTGALLGPIAPTAMHMCTRMSRDRVAEGSAIGLCAASFRLAALLLAVAPLLPPFTHVDDITYWLLTWLPLFLSAAAAVRCMRILRATRRIHTQDILHNSGAFEQVQMNGSSAAAFKVKDVQATLRSERVLKKWAFGYLCLTFENWKEFTMQQRSKKTSVGAQREFLRVSKVTDADVMDLRRSTYDAELQFEKMRKMNK